MILNVFWTKRAENKVKNILKYLEVEWGERIEKNFTQKLNNLINLLSEFPELGAIQNTERNIRGILVNKQISIYYKVRKNDLIILNIFDNRQNPNKKRF